jgi:hypothetical protein
LICCTVHAQERQGNALSSVQVHVSLQSAVSSTTRLVILLSTYDRIHPTVHS